MVSYHAFKHRKRNAATSGTQGLDGEPVRYRVFSGVHQDVREAADVADNVWSSRAGHGGAGAPNLTDRQPLHAATVGCRGTPRRTWLIDNFGPTHGLLFNGRAPCRDHPQDHSSTFFPPLPDGCLIPMHLEGGVILIDLIDEYS